MDSFEDRLSSLGFRVQRSKLEIPCRECHLKYYCTRDADISNTCKQYFKNRVCLLHDEGIPIPEWPVLVAAVRAFKEESKVLKAMKEVHS